MYVYSIADSAVSKCGGEWTDLWGEGADQEVSLRQEVDVQDDSSQRVLGVAVVKACRPWDGVITDELIVWIPGGDKKAGVRVR